MKLIMVSNSDGCRSFVAESSVLYPLKFVWHRLCPRSRCHYSPNATVAQRESDCRLICSLSDRYTITRILLVPRSPRRCGGEGRERILFHLGLFWTHLLPPQLMRVPGVPFDVLTINNVDHAIKNSRNRFSSGGVRGQLSAMVFGKEVIGLGD